MLPLAESEQQILLRMAREALVESVSTGKLGEMTPPPEAPTDPCGAFVTLRRDGRLRGCIGYIESTKPLYETVRECALSAALRDMRFDHVEPDEVPLIHIEISVLSPLVEIPPEEVEVGRHGLLISRGRIRGVLLPQVPVEWKWDRERFLTETCRKAGLPGDDWKNGARIQAFTAQIFTESPAHDALPRSSALL